MTDHVYKTIELTGSSKVGIDDAVKKALAKASKTLHNLRWFQITEIRGNVDGGAVASWQVSLKVGFTLDDRDATSARAGCQTFDGRRSCASFKRANSRSLCTSVERVSCAAAATRARFARCR